MGSLAVAGPGDGEGGGAGASADANEPEGQEPEGAEGGEETQPERPLSRREAATKALIEKELGAFRSTYDQRLSQAQMEAQQRIAAVQAENARLVGALEEMRRAPAQPAAPPVKRDDPDELERQAAAELDPQTGKGLSEYHRKMRMANDIRAEQKAEALFESKFKAWEETQKKNAPPPALPANIMHLVAKHDHVAMAGAMPGQRGERLVTNKAESLLLSGRWQPGPALLAKAFELAEADLKAESEAQAAATPRFDPSTGAALGGVPSTRAPAAGAGSGGGEGAGKPKLNPTEEGVRQTMKMSVEDYLEWKADPEAAARKMRKAQRR